MTSFWRTTQTSYRLVTIPFSSKCSLSCKFLLLPEQSMAGWSVVRARASVGLLICVTVPKCVRCKSVDFLLCGSTGVHVLICRWQQCAIVCNVHVLICRLKDMYFGLETYWTLLRKWQALINSCYDILSTPKVWDVLARNWLQIIQVSNLKRKTYKLETSQSPEYSERKYCLLLFSFRRSI